MKFIAPRSRRQIAVAAGVKVRTVRTMQKEGVLPAGNLTLADELVVRALLWADGARGGNLDAESALAATVRQVLDTSEVGEGEVLVLVDGRVHWARDALEALLLVRGRVVPVTLLPIGAWIAGLAIRSGQRAKTSAARHPVPVTRAQVAAAQGRIVTDERLGEETPAWVLAVADAQPVTQAVPVDPR